MYLVCALQYVYLNRDRILTSKALFESRSNNVLIKLMLLQYFTIFTCNTFHLIQKWYQNACTSKNSFCTSIIRIAIKSRYHYHEENAKPVSKFWMYSQITFWILSVRQQKTLNPVCTKSFRSLMESIIAIWLASHYLASY